MMLTTARVMLRTPDATMAERLLDYTIRNRERFAASGPQVTTTPSLDTAQASIASALRDQEQGTGCRFHVFEHGHEEIIGDLAFSNIMRGVFQACYLGYRIDAAFEGRGYMREALACALEYAFGELGLHRVMANYVPTNARSGALLRRLGFTVEGYARDYLMLNGAWQDHVLTSLVAPTQP